MKIMIQIAMICILILNVDMLGDCIASGISYTGKQFSQMN